MKRGKKYVEAAKLIDRSVLYDKEEAIALVKKSATAKFDETIEAHIRTGCDGRHAEQQIRGAVVLPHGTGKKVRVLVFAKDAKAEEKYIEDLLAEIAKNTEIDVPETMVNDETERMVTLITCNSRLDKEIRMAVHGICHECYGIEKAEPK